MPHLDDLERFFSTIVALWWQSLITHMASDARTAVTEGMQSGKTSSREACGSTETAVKFEDTQKTPTVYVAELMGIHQAYSIESNAAPNRYGSLPTTRLPFKLC
jgi:hypothetical protein